MVLWPTRSPLMAVILYPCLLLSFIQVGFRGTTTDLSKQTRSVERGLWRMVWGAHYWTGNLGVIKVYSDFEEKVDLPRDLLRNTDIECLHLFSVWSLVSLLWKCRLYVECGFDGEMLSRLCWTLRSGAVPRYWLRRLRWWGFSLVHQSNPNSNVMWWINDNE